MGTGNLSLGVIYALAAMCCLAAAFYPVSLPNQPHSLALWSGCALLLAALSISSFWRIEYVLLDSLRTLAHQWGLYEDRRTLQVAVLLASLVIATLIGALMRKHTHWSSLSRATRTLTITTGLLAILWWCRLLSLHYVDAVLYQNWWGLSIGRWLEAVLLGITLLACAAQLRSAYEWS